MSLLSTKGVYGLAAMYELSKSQDNKPMQNKDIAKRADIPKNYLEQLLPLLRQAGLIKSIRGANGGFMLAKNAKDISIKDIFIALEGKLQIVSCDVNPTCKLFFAEYDEKLQKLFDLPLSNLSEYEERVLGQINYII